MTHFKLFSLTILFVVILDMIWLGYVGKSFYSSSIGHILKQSSTGLAPNIPAAIAVYIFISLGILFFVLPKAPGDLLQIWSWGILYGAVVYGVYDFTNLAILAQWPLSITLIDFVWGTFLCSSSALFAGAVQKYWFT